MTEKKDSHSKRPNIILILADDMGYSDIGCYGSEIQTPNLDRMAQNGIRFSQMYNCARCCPTRASLLTGLYPHKAGVGAMVSDWNLPGYRGFLQDNCVTIAEVLAGAGYQTFMSGKWHVGGDYAVHLPETWSRAGEPGHPTPRQRGFQEFYGILCGGGSYYNPRTLMHNDLFLPIETDDYYLTDALSDRAADMVRSAPQNDSPFFLYLAYTAPHWPLHARQEDIARYTGQYRNGWDATRTSRHETLNSLGILEKSWTISRRDENAPPWESASNKEWEDMRMAVYAAQIDRMDQGIGRIMNALRESGQEENTMVIFLADNGGCAEFLNENGTPGTWPERYSIPNPDGSPTVVGNNPGRLPGSAQTFMSYDLPWANVSNSPFRLFKHWVHEGGIATPCIVQWPRGIKSPSVDHSPSHVIDITATCIDVAEATYPTEYNATPITPLQGESFSGVFDGKRWNREQPIYFEHEGNRAVRDGNWKLVSRHPNEWELYDMDEDRTELHDIIDKNEPVAERLVHTYNEWVEENDVLQWPVRK
jgi:arylsulfatase A-like enzyme